MSNYMQYQKYRREPEGQKLKIGKVIIIVAIVFVIYLIGRSVFGGGSKVETNIANDNSQNTNSLASSDLNSNSVNGNTNLGVNSNANGNSNTNAPANGNTNTVSTSVFKVNDCTRVISKGSSDRQQIALTFNVGTAKEGDIQKVLDALTATKTAADFFARGEVAESNPELIRKINSAGFSIYNASYSNPHFNDLPESAVAEQLSKADAAISALTSKSTKPFFRPPFGEADDDVLATVKKSGYCPVTWTIDALDWSSETTASQSQERVLSKATNGAIVVMQAGNATTAQILPEVITQLKAKGYSLVNLETLFAS